ncbi:MAG: hypothetical protein PHQ98_02545 [Candidatus ainarchaeum sp.]|nr:hypothetical protein [Candidatus ainarchaeum sp.]
MSNNNMDLIIGLIDFFKFVIPLAVLFLIVYSILEFFQKKLNSKYNLSFIKSFFIINSIFIFIAILAFYLYFILIGYLLVDSSAVNPDLAYTLVENIFMVLSGVFRILLISIILSLVFLSIELFYSVVFDVLKKNISNELIRKFISSIITIAIFMLIFVFFFSWVPIGIFVYVFYGGAVNQVPLFLLI